MSEEKTIYPDRKLHWPSVFGIGITHLLALLAFVPTFFSWSGLGLAVFLGWLSGWIGITLCFHRLLTHGSFRTPNWFRYFLTICGTLAWQGGPITWIGTHRIHHAFSDKEGDPHSPRHGPWWAHVFWTVFERPSGVRDPLGAALDLWRDKTMRVIDRFFWVPQVLCAIALFVAGLLFFNIVTAVSWLVWGIGVRTVVIYHITWAINSACHIWGYRNFDTADQSKNFWPIAILSAGESFHNNHHADQRSARHGMRWWEIDITWYTILVLKFFRLAYDIKLPSESVVAKIGRANKTEQVVA